MDQIIPQKHKKYVECKTICSKIYLGLFFSQNMQNLPTSYRGSFHTCVSLRWLLSSVISYQIASVQLRNYRNQMLDVEVSREEIEEAATVRFELLSGR